MTAADRKKLLLHYTHRVARNGWVANHDGNLSLRLDGDLLLSTPTAMAKEDVRSDDLLVIDGQGAVVSGKRRVFSEINLHLAAYGARSDVNAVVHAHPPRATALSVAGVTIEKPIIAEAVVSIGDRIPLVPYAMPGTPESARLVEEHLQLSSVLILQNHGVLTVGADLEQAYLRMELVEHLATIYLHALSAGRVNPIPATDVDELLQRHRKAGLAAPLAGLQEAAERASPAADGELIDLVTREVMRVLAEK
ncbi:MAG: class II aldolase/adducin family protein [Myxococcales bacterium]|nr:class II aldolase/adducin family protein [Myxococcales bacterium]